MKKVAFYTLGCKLNQAETAMLARQFLDRGYKIVSIDERPDVFVVNTCTVTERSAAKSRKAARKIARENPDSVVIVTGCYAQVSQDEAKNIKGIDYVLGTNEKLNLFRHFGDVKKQNDPVVKITGRDFITDSEINTPQFLDNTRAFLKIQDGCDNFCTFCIVPYARGPSRSVHIDKILNQARIFITNGFKEIVLTGVHIGKWNMEAHGGKNLAYLLQKLLEIDFDGRIRLGSLEPKEITDELLDILAQDERVCRHFHVSLQSGSDSVLKRMNRTYTIAKVKDRIDAVVKRFSNPGIGSDIITGFPGETEIEFDETMNFIDKTPFTYLHVFPYSIRRRTTAAGFKNQVPSKIKKDRASLLRNTSREKKSEFVKKWIGKEVLVLAEEKKSNNKMSGFTSEYLKVDFRFNQKISNTIVPVVIDYALSDRGFGRVIKIV